MASTLLVAAAPAQAITTPVAGQPCGQDDLGRRAPKVVSATTDRAVKVGIQAVGTGSMFATLGGSLAVAAPVVQYSTGRDDDTGTFSLMPV